MIRALVESLTITDVRSRLAEVALPALVLQRRSDFVPFSEAKLMTTGIRGARLVELEGSDHLPWVGDVSGVLSPIARLAGEAVIAERVRLGIARLDMAAGALGAAWFQMSALEQALDDPAAVRDKPTVGVAQPDTQTGAHPPGPKSGAAVGHDVADRVPDQGAEFGAGDVIERVPGHEQPPEHRAQ